MFIIENDFLGFGARYIKYVHGPWARYTENTVHGHWARYIANNVKGPWIFM